MKKILIALFCLIYLTSCVKEVVHEQEDNYCIIDKLFSPGYGSSLNIFDSIKFVKVGDNNILHLTGTLSQKIIRHYEAKPYREDTTYIWSHTTSDRFNFYINQVSRDSVKFYNKEYTVYIITPDEQQYYDYLCQLGYQEDKKYYYEHYLDFPAYYDNDNNYIYKRKHKFSIKDTCIDIICPHHDIEREYYYYRYYEKQ